MKFQDWFNDAYTLEERMTNPDLRPDLLVCWNACREEILKILKTESMFHMSMHEGKSRRYFPQDVDLVIKEIEKL
ncbi:MAG: hypothetical protein AABY22_19205 [Nanoarchaeota archaeon]